MKFRKLRLQTGATNTEATLSAVENAAEIWFSKLNKDELLRQMFIDGYTHEDIANWAEAQGYLDIDKETFKRYLRAYRKIKRAYFNEVEDLKTFGGLAGFDVPIGEHKNFVLMKLRAALRVMERRLAVATNNELNVNMLMANTNKDFRVYLDMLGAYDKVLKTGTLSKQEATDVSDILGETNAFAMEDRINKEKEAQDRLSSLVQDIVKVKRK